MELQDASHCARESEERYSPPLPATKPTLLSCPTEVILFQVSYKVGQISCFTQNRFKKFKKSTEDALVKLVKVKNCMDCGDG